MNLSAINSKTGKVLLSHAGNVSEATFKGMLHSSFPNENMDDIVLVCDGNIIGKEKIGLPSFSAISKKAVVWRGSFCLLPDSKILTSKGTKPIKDIEIGDMVFTHLGRLKKVIRKYQRKWNGKIFNIRTILDKEELSLTPEHRVIAIKGTPCAFRKCSTCKAGCQTQFNKTKGTYYCSHRFYKNYLTENILASELTNNDFLLLPKLDNAQKTNKVNILPYFKNIKTWSTDNLWIWPTKEHNKTNLITIARNMNKKEDWLYPKSKKSKKIVDTIISLSQKKPPQYDPVSAVNKIPVEYDLNYDFGRFLGLYVAEGSGKMFVSFSFHENETHLQDFIVQSAKNIFSLKASKSLDPKKKSATVKINSVLLSRLFKQWSGEDCYSKKIPNFIFSSNDDTITGFINGLWEGDGCKKPRIKDNTIKYATVSPSLAYGLRFLLSKFGVTAAISVEHPKPIQRNNKQYESAQVYVIKISGNQLYQNKWLQQFQFNCPKNIKHPRTRQYFSNEQGSFVQITSIKESFYDGDVYDLEIEDDHSYIANGKAVKNCDLGGYAGMNREISLRLINRGFAVKLDILKTAPQVDPVTMSMLNALASVKLPNESNCPFVVGFTPMSITNRKGKVIFFTMMETTGKIHPEFVDRCNKFASEIWVPCKFYLDAFKKSGVVKPIYLMPLGVNERIYNSEAKEPQLAYDDILTGKRINTLPNSFRFISLFGWSYRKGPDVLCRSFIREFSSKDDACLVIYSRFLCSDAEGQKAYVRNEILNYYKEIGKENPPPIYYCGDTIPISDLPGCYAASNCFVFCSRGEGFGLPVIEAGACGVPVISTYNTAMEQYLDKDVAFLVDTDEIATANDKLTFITEFYRDQLFPVLGEKCIREFMRLMRLVYGSNEGKGKAIRFKERILKEYTWDVCADRVAERLENITHLL